MIKPIPGLKELRAAGRDSCEECGRPPTLKAVISNWRSDRRRTREHNEWHLTATEQELETHRWFEEQTASFARVVEESLLRELQPRTRLLEYLRKREES